MEKRRNATQRMNIGVSIENSDFVKTLARATNTTTGDVINSILTKYRLDNPDLLEQTDIFLTMVKNKLPGIDGEVIMPDDDGN